MSEFTLSQPAGGMFSNQLRLIEKSLRDLRWCAVLRNAFALLVEPGGGSHPARSSEGAFEN